MGLEGLPRKLCSEIEVFVKDECGNLYRLDLYQATGFNIYKINHNADGNSAWLVSWGENRSPELLKTDYKLSTKHITEEFENICKSCEYNKEKILEVLIDKDSYMPTELGAKMIRTIDVNEECVSKLYRSVSFLTNNVSWLDFGKMFNIGSVDGDANTIVVATIKSSINGKVIESNNWPYNDRIHEFKLEKQPDGFLKIFLDRVFADYRTGLRVGNDSWTKIELLKFMSFWVYIAEKMACNT